MSKLFDTALPPIWYLAFWLFGFLALYLAIRFGIAHGLRDAALYVGGVSIGAAPSRTERG